MNNLAAIMVLSVGGRLDRRCPSGLVLQNQDRARLMIRPAGSAPELKATNQIELSHWRKYHDNDQISGAAGKSGAVLAALMEAGFPAVTKMSGGGPGQAAGHQDR